MGAYQGTLLDVQAWCVCVCVSVGGCWKDGLASRIPDTEIQPPAPFFLPTPGEFHWC